ncbi:MAG: YbhB/YbcL family Raf kinase inhibitor-like protein [Rhizobiaceae bacterium]
MRKFMPVIIAAHLMLVSGAAMAMSVSVSWGPTKACFDSKSPPMTVSGVPDGTRKLKIAMVDLDAPSYPHGGGTVSWAGKGSLPYGAFSYKGPCPPSPHRYQFTVKAIGDGNKTLATAKATKRFP